MSEAAGRDSGKGEVPVQDAHARQFPVEAIALTTALFLSILGVGITDYSPLQSYRYWGAMTLVLASSGMAIGWSRVHRLGLPVAKTLGTQLIHWAATGVAVGGILLLLKAGRLNYESTGLVLLIVLGLATFLDGYRINWRFSLVGLLIFVSGITAAYVEEYLWVLLVIATGVAVAVLLWERHERSRRRQVPTE